jgi:hypothetical protein
MKRLKIERRLRVCWGLLRRQGDTMIVRVDGTADNGFEHDADLTRVVGECIIGVLALRSAGHRMRSTRATAATHLTLLRAFLPSPRTPAPRLNYP